MATNLTAPWELYDLSTAPTEIENLSEQNPKKVNELKKLWTSWAESHQVLPLDD